MAISSFELTPPAALHDSTETLLRELGNGHAASARFDADLAETRALAARTPPITAVPGNSRLVAEVLLLVRYVELGNGGCDACGGAVATELPEIRWEPVPWNPGADGTIGQPGAGIDFSADLRPDGTWHVKCHRLLKRRGDHPARRFRAGGLVSASRGVLLAAIDGSDGEVMSVGGGRPHAPSGEAVVSGGRGRRPSGLAPLQFW
uniref:hypothetical protein n=1 Tax=Saccharothrix mutabilis TaxID=33921 RepID=UPI0031DEFAF5